MAAIATCRLIVELDGLGENLQFPEAFTTTTTPTTFTYMRQTQTTADTEEALDIGNVTTPLLIVMKCITNDVDVDCNYSSSFSADITINEGEVAVFRPAGTVYIKNDDSEEESVVEFLVIGT